MIYTGESTYKLINYNRILSSSKIWFYIRGISNSSIYILRYTRMQFLIGIVGGLTLAFVVADIQSDGRDNLIKPQERQNRIVHIR